MWKEDKKPIYGDQIRVNRGFYYHHGIYLSDEEVIHFTALDGDGILNPDNVKIMKTTLDTFLKGMKLEIKQYTDEELSKKRSSDEVVKYAINCLGKTGYNLISYNCEHFSNECVFGEKTSEQVNSILGEVFGLFR